MFLVPKIAMPHLIAALKTEIVQEEDTAAWVEGDDGPEGYDPNDLPLFESILEMLEDAYARQVEAVSLWGKPLSFMVWPLPQYLHNNGSTLTFEERQALEDVLDRQLNYQDR
jgi:hypothetical protein